MCADVQKLQNLLQNLYFQHHFFSPVYFSLDRSGEDQNGFLICADLNLTLPALWVEHFKNTIFWKNFRSI